MLFNSISFLIFAPIFFVLYFNLYGRKRLLWCIITSYFFYACWDWRFLGLIIGSTLVAFYSGRMIGKSHSLGIRKFWIYFCIITHLGALCFFKYFIFCSNTIKSIVNTLGFNINYENPTILLPVGISFYTFTALCYTIDIYRGKIKQPEPSLLKFATYECVFPHLVAGPILRARKFLPQLSKDHPFDWKNAAKGLEMIAWGYFLKICLADNASLFADIRFQSPELFTSSSLIVAVFAFAFQIYGDFAGYSLIAIGLARIMGFDFGINFNKPYFATNFSNFWERWHISLSSWIRDYIYIPLGGSKQGNSRTIINLTFTMFLAGLWHGAGWTFVVWGFVHGLYLVLQRIINKPYRFICKLFFIPKQISNLMSIMIVFLLTCIAWVFFRAENIDKAIFIFKAIFDWDATAHLTFGGMKYHLLRVTFVLCIVLLVDFLSSFEKIRSQYQRNQYARVFLVGLLFIFILFTGNFSANSFIYFQF